MKYWTHEELHEIEEKLLDRKATVKYLGDNKMKRIPWPYEAWEETLIECCAEDGCPIDAVERFLHRTKGDVTHHIRERGYEKNADKSHNLCYVRSASMPFFHRL